MIRNILIRHVAIRSEHSQCSASRLGSSGSKHFEFLSNHFESSKFASMRCLLLLCCFPHCTVMQKQIILRSFFMIGLKTTHFIFRDSCRERSCLSHQATTTDRARCICKSLAYFLSSGVTLGTVEVGIDCVFQESKDFKILC